MTTANEKQIGGAHYKTAYNHWDLVLNIPLGYLEGCTTKYVTRWRKKNGLDDLRKAEHYLEKLMESHVINLASMTADEMHIEVNHFARANQLDFLEKEYILAICMYIDSQDLGHAKDILTQLINEATVEEAERKEKQEASRPGTPEDGGHHANQAV